MFSNCLWRLGKKNEIKCVTATAFRAKLSEIVSLPVYFQLTERSHLWSATLEQIRTYPNSAANVRNTFWTTDAE
jgi:hypothetical protein